MNPGHRFHLGINTVIKSDISKCKCKSGKNNINCLSHYHKSLRCSNGNKCDVYQKFKEMFPKWGDEHTSNEIDFCVYNTCTVDNWLDLVYIIAN